MSNTRYARPVVGDTPAGVGVTYIPLNRWAARTAIQVDAVGTVTFTVDDTRDTIHYDMDADPLPINLQNRGNDVVSPASAFWSNVIASGSADAQANRNRPVAALRINITAGTGSVTYHIQQT